MNELFVVVITIHVIGFTQLVDDSQVKVAIGWSMISFICMMLTSNLGPIIFDLGNSIRLCLIKLYRIVMRWFIKKFHGKMP